MTNLKNISLLLVSNDKFILEKAKNDKDKFKNLVIKNSDNFIQAYLNSNINIDVIILDLDEASNIDLSPILYMNATQQFVFLASKRQVYLKFLKKFDGGKSVVLFKPIKFSAIIDNLLLISSSKKESYKLIKLTQSISIDLASERIYDEGNEIFLSAMLHKLIILFSSNLGNLVTFEMIESSVYDNTPNSRIIVQNLVGNLKRTLNLNIKNIYGKGYILHSFE